MKNLAKKKSMVAFLWSLGEDYKDVYEMFKQEMELEERMIEVNRLEEI